MNEKSKIDLLQDALENLVRNREGLSWADLRSRIRQIAKQAIADADAADRAGRAAEAASLYRLVGQVYRRLAELAPADQRASELVTAQFWEERAKLVEKHQSGISTPDTPPEEPRKSGSIHSPVPMPLKSSIERGPTSRSPGFVGSDRRRSDRVERSPRRQVDELDRPRNDRGSFRKRGE